MLDSHPRLAVPGESEFIISLRDPMLRLRRRPEAALEAILSNEKFRAWGLDPDTVRSDVAAEGPTDFVDVVRAVYASFARLHGKVRWGDKTPGYALHLRTLARLFPDARFVHLIRDGREVAASLAERTWGPSSAVSGAFWWRQLVASARRAGTLLGPDRYLEIRLEDLICDPEGVLTRVCDFLGEKFEPEMLDYSATIESRYPGHHERGEHLLRPPTAGLRDWRAALSERDERLLEAACRRWLVRLGYPTEGPALPLARAQVVGMYLRDKLLPGRPVTLWAWLDPGQRHPVTRMLDRFRVPRRSVRGTGPGDRRNPPSGPGPNLPRPSTSSGTSGSGPEVQ